MLLDVALGSGFLGDRKGGHRSKASGEKLTQAVQSNAKHKIPYRC